MLQEDVVRTQKKIGQILDNIEPYVLLNEDRVRSIEESMEKIYAIAMVKRQTQVPIKKKSVKGKVLPMPMHVACSPPDVCDMV